MYSLLVLKENNQNLLTAHVINSPQTLSWHMQHSKKTIPTICIIATVMWQFAAKEKMGLYLLFQRHFTVLNNDAPEHLLDNWRSLHLRQDSWLLWDKQAQLQFLEVKWKIHPCVVMLNIKALFTDAGSQRRKWISFRWYIPYLKQYWSWENFNTCRNRLRIPQYVKGTKVTYTWQKYGTILGQFQTWSSFTERDNK